MEKFVNTTCVLPLIEEKSKIRVDFIFSWSLYEKQAIRRAKNIKIGNGIVKFTSPEDVIIQKIVSGRERDIEDLRAILAKNSNLEEDYILKWLSEFEKAEKLLHKFSKIKKDARL